MRLFLQVVSLAVVVFLGWNEPFRDMASNALPWADIAPSRLAVIKERARRAAIPQERFEVPTPRPASGSGFESTSPLQKPPVKFIPR